MFKKVNNVFRPNHHHHHHHHRAQDHGLRGRQDYHSACTVRLVRSTSMLVIGEKTQTAAASDSTLKRSKSTVSVESTTALYYYQRQEDQIWLYSQNQNCLEYLEELVALRRQYTRSIHDLTSSSSELKASTKKRAPPPPPPPPPKHAQRSSVRPSAPPLPNEDDTLQYFDAVIDSCDADRGRKPPVDDGNADVDFIVASSSKEHDLHSNWVMRVPRGAAADGSREKAAAPPAPGRGTAAAKKKKKSSSSGSTSSRLRLQRNPIHLPKVVESAFQTLRFKPNLKK